MKFLTLRRCSVIQQLYTAAGKIWADVPTVFAFLLSQRSWNIISQEPQTFLTWVIHHNEIYSSFVFFCQYSDAADFLSLNAFGAFKDIMTSGGSFSS